MSFKKFGDKDVFINTMKAYPQNEFLVYDSKIYWNNIPDQVGVRHSKVRNVPPGFVSLYEYNIDRPAGNNIHPFSQKKGTRIRLKLPPSCNTT